MRPRAKQPARALVGVRSQQAKLPAVFGSRRWVEAGELLSYGAPIDPLFERAADLIDKIIKGASPATMPMEQPARFEVVLNFTTAKELGLKIPQAVLVSVTNSVE